MIEGWDKLQKQFGRIANLDWIAAEVEGLNIIADEAKNLVPVDEGNLQDTIAVQVEGDVVQLVAGGGDLPVDYQGYVEFGTSKMPAQPYMRPAIDNKQGEALKAVAANLEGQIGKVANG
jgi:HK97 gp10 family phage protein